MNTSVNGKFSKSIIYTSAFVGLLWIIKLIENLFDYDFGIYGIFPRTIRGSLGIITGPLVHGDEYHLISNTLPILILGIGIIYFYEKAALSVFTLIYFMTGFWVWVAAREAYHIGASGLVYGMLFFLLFSGFIRKDPSTLAISFIVLLIYGGSLFSGFVPTEETVSWESHILGAVAGTFCAVYFRKTTIFSPLDFFEEDIESVFPIPNKNHTDGTGPTSLRYTYVKKKEPKNGRVTAAEKTPSATNRTYIITYRPNIRKKEETPLRDL